MRSFYGVLFAVAILAVFVAAAPTSSLSTPQQADTLDTALVPPKYLNLRDAAKRGMEAGMNKMAIPVHDKLQPFFSKHAGKPWMLYAQKAMDIGNSGIALGVGGLLGTAWGAMLNAYSGAKYGYNRFRQRLGYRPVDI
ncbi:hypothetical protein H4R34_003076 [Dimargaris verticillata]|uniref:Uncharacterized protein n=1 Tax=Dimargaris verticillata TaxID=2761393 RepID=A0A9W8EDH4_9FUNG|nr:hypothetical protein H4R34_003076 [Dimargaris verticillata]